MSLSSGLQSDVLLAYALLFCGLWPYGLQTGVLLPYALLFCGLWSYGLLFFSLRSYGLYSVLWTYRTRSSEAPSYAPRSCGLRFCGLQSCALLSYEPRSCASPFCGQRSCALLLCGLRSGALFEVFSGDGSSAWVTLAL